MNKLLLLETDGYYLSSKVFHKEQFSDDNRPFYMEYDSPIEALNDGWGLLSSPTKMYSSYIWSFTHE